MSRMILYRFLLQLHFCSLMDIAVLINDDAVSYSSPFARLVATWSQQVALPLAVQR